MFECLGSQCPGCSTCDPLQPSGLPMKNVTPRKLKTKACGLCSAPVAKREEAIIVGPHVTCLACTFPDGNYSALAATAAAQRLAAKHGLSIPEGFAFK